MGSPESGSRSGSGEEAVPLTDRLSRGSGPSHYEAPKCARFFRFHSPLTFRTEGQDATRSGSRRAVVSVQALESDPTMQGTSLHLGGCSSEDSPGSRRMGAGSPPPRPRRIQARNPVPEYSHLHSVHSKSRNRRHNRRDEPCHRVARLLRIHLVDLDDVTVVIDAEQDAAAGHRRQTPPPSGTHVQRQVHFPTPQDALELDCRPFATGGARAPSPRSSARPQSRRRGPGSSVLDSSTTKSLSIGSGLRPGQPMPLAACRAAGGSAPSAQRPRGDNTSDGPGKADASSTIAPVEAIALQRHLNIDVRLQFHSDHAAGEGRPLKDGGHVVDRVPRVESEAEEAGNCLGKAHKRWTVPDDRSLTAPGRQRLGRESGTTSSARRGSRTRHMPADWNADSTARSVRLSRPGA